MPPPRERARTAPGRRLSPPANYSLGWLPRWAALAARAPRLANLLLATPVLSQVAKHLAGVQLERHALQLRSRCQIANDEAWLGPVALLGGA